MLVRVIICWAVILTIVTARGKAGEFEVDEDDEDHFGVANEATYLRDDFYRKRRSQEEGFYHTLLSRSEPQHVFKRSHGTEDFEHSNAMFITERDWTGSSKISDADRKELETLFSKLNADDSETKTDVTRSIPDDEGLSPLDHAAYKYAAWLMGQPSNKIGDALTQKAQVDHRLTRLFFDKRGLDLILPNQQEPLTNQRKSIIKKAHSRHNTPHPEVSTEGLQNSTAKHLIMSGPKLCTDDSAKCLCTRACYPNTAVSVSPCQCEGKGNSDGTATQRSPVATPVVTAAQPAAAVTGSVAAPFPPQAPTMVKTEFPPQAPTVAKTEVPPQASTVAKTEVSPQASVTTKSLINVNQAAPHPVNGSAAVLPVSDKTVSMVTAAEKTPQVTSSVATTNATVKSDVFAVALSPLSTVPAPALAKAANSTSAEPAESKSIEPIRSTRQKLRLGEGVPIPANVVPSNETAGLFGSNKPIYVDHPSYQGCYKDRKPIRDLPKRFTRFDTTPESCIMECKYQNYKFAGVQYGYLCFCGNAFGRYGKVSDKDCNSFCNGDPKRKCGAFWHNSVYSVDGSPYDPGLFDFAKIDEEERMHDELSPPAVKLAKKSSTKAETHVNIQGANAATHLVDAAQATLKAAKKLLPGVSKKHKIGKDASRDKREDDEDDAELMYERENALASLKAAHSILQKTNFEKAKRSAEKEKRSISEDFDPYDPDDGKDVLKAYMSSVEAYNRQTRSVDDEEEDDGAPEKDNFQYRRMSEAELEEGQFVDKYADNSETQENTETYAAKRDAEKDVLSPSSSTKKGEKQKSKKRSVSEVEVDVKDTKITAPIKRDVAEPIVKREVAEPIVKRDVAEPIKQQKVAPIVKEDEADATVKRSVQESVVESPIQEQTPSRIKKRNLPENHARSATAHGSGGGEDRKKRESESIQKVHEGSGGGSKKRSISESIQKIQGSGGGYKKKRSISEYIQKVHAGSGEGYKKKRSISEPIQKIREDSVGYKKRRSLREPVQIVHEYRENNKKRRSLNEPVQIIHESKRGLVNKKRRSLENSKEDISNWYTELQENKLDEKIRKTLTEASKPLAIFPVFNADSASSVKAKRDVSSRGPKTIASRKRNLRKKAQKVKVVGQPGERRHINKESKSKQKETIKVIKEIPWDKKKRSVVETQYEGSRVTRHDVINNEQIARSRRELPNNNLSDGALKMAARSDDINDIEKSLQGLESIEKKDKIATSGEKAERDSESSGNGESDSADDFSGDENKKNASEKESKSVNKRSSEDEKSADVKKSKIAKENKESKEIKEIKEAKENSSDDVKLKGDVEKGVDSLLNLVVELYKQQKTIKNFENSVRTLRHDILKELNIPSKDKHAATKKVRNAIQTAAKERLHTLTSSIEHKITEFAKRHPESVKQAKLATSLLPKIPMSDKKLAESKREISRRSAEFDNIEDGFVESAQLPVPDILKEHFKRNAERDIEDFEPVKQNAEREEEDREPKKRNAERDDEERKPRKRNSEEDVEYEPRTAEGNVEVKKRSMEGDVRRQTEINGERTLSRMHRDVSESEEEGLDDDDEDEDEQNEDYERLFK